MIGTSLPERTFRRMLKREDEIRAAAKVSPVGAYYIVNRKNILIEEVLYQWLQVQRKQNILVNGKMIKNAGMILVDLQDDSGHTVPEAPSSFSVS
ncbi:hypothetical protein BGZ54_002784 [Gamsiella multidivaricata]|nr:hypothetical protein BGZ54_002784 [Gamsiella multidivaricata]